MGTGADNVESIPRSELIEFLKGGTVASEVFQTKDRDSEFNDTNHCPTRHSTGRAQRRRAPVSFALGSTDGPLTAYVFIHFTKEKA